MNNSNNYEKNELILNSNNSYKNHEYGHSQKKRFNANSNNRNIFSSDDIKRNDILKNDNNNQKDKIIKENSPIEKKQGISKHLEIKKVKSILIEQIQKCEYLRNNYECDPNNYYDYKVNEQIKKSENVQIKDIENKKNSLKSKLDLLKTIKNNTKNSTNTKNIEEKEKNIFNSNRKISIKPNNFEEKPDNIKISNRKISTIENNIEEKEEHVLTENSKFQDTIKSMLCLNKDIGENIKIRKFSSINENLKRNFNNDCSKGFDEIANNALFLKIFNVNENINPLNKYSKSLASIYESFNDRLIPSKRNHINTKLVRKSNNQNIIVIDDYCESGKNNSNYTVNRDTLFNKYNLKNDIIHSKKKINEKIKKYKNRDISKFAICKEDSNALIKSTNEIVNTKSIIPLLKETLSSAIKVEYENTKREKIVSENSSNLNNHMDNDSSKNMQKKNLFYNEMQVLERKTNSINIKEQGNNKINGEISNTVNCKNLFKYDIIDIKQLNSNSIFKNNKLNKSPAKSNIELNKLFIKNKPIYIKSKNMSIKDDVNNMRKFLYQDENKREKIIIKLIDKKEENSEIRLKKSFLNFNTGIFSLPLCFNMNNKI